MTIAEGLIDFLWDFRDEKGLSINDVLMDVAEGSPDVLSVAPSSDHTIKRYLNGDEVKEANFQVFLMAYTKQNYKRIENTQLIDKMKEWINRREHQARQKDKGAR